MEPVPVEALFDRIEILLVGSHRSKTYQAVLWEQYRHVWAPQHQMSVLVTVGGRGVRAGAHALTIANGALTIDGPRIRCQVPTTHVAYAALCGITSTAGDAAA